MAPITLLTHDKPETTTTAANTAVRRRKSFNQPLQIAILVQSSDLVGPTHVHPAHIDPRKTQILLSLSLPNYPLQLVQERPIHGHVSLVDLDLVPLEDGSDGPAVIERLPDHAEAGVVDHHPILGVRRRLIVVAVCGGRPGPDPVEDGGFSGGAGGVSEEGLDVFEGNGLAVGRSRGTGRVAGFLEGERVLVERTETERGVRRVVKEECFDVLEGGGVVVEGASRRRKGGVGGGGGEVEGGCSVVAVNPGWGFHP